MKSASVNEIKQELTSLKPPRLIELNLRLARFKKENKELLTYLLFEAHDPEGYVRGVKEEVAQQFTEVKSNHLYFAKKTLRKIVRGIRKQVRYIGSKTAEAELLIFFCRKMQETGIAYERNAVLRNMYNLQIRKIMAAVKTLHEDLQHDYLKELEEISG